MSSRILGEAMGAARVAYGDVSAEAGTIEIGPDWTAEGMATISGLHRFADYGDHLPDILAGRPVVINDVTSDVRTCADPAPLLALGIQALVDLPLMEQGRTVAQILVHSRIPRAWTDDEIAFVQEFAERTRAAIARRRAEQEVRASQHELQELTDALPLLVSFIDREQRYVFNNRAYLDWFGQTPDDLRGGTMVEVLGEAAHAILEPTIDRALFGEHVVVEQTLPYRHGGERHVRVEYIPRRDKNGAVDGFYAVVADMTERHLAEVALHANEARLRFLDDLAQATAALNDADAILAVTTRMVAQHLEVSNCAYADMDEDQDGFTIRGDWAAPGTPSIVGHYSLADFGKLAVQELGAGRPLIINDNLSEIAPEEAATFQSIGIAATICMPLVKEGRLAALMAIHRSRPHTWTEEELSLIREVTQRSWAHVERVGAEAELRDSEARYRRLFDTIDEGFCVLEFVDGPHGPLSDYVHVEANAAAAEQAGLADVVGRSIRELVGDEAEVWVDIYGQVLRTGQPVRFERELLATGRWLELAAFRIEPQSRNQVAVLFKDLTERKHAETALRESEAQFRAFAEAVPNHVWASRPDGHLYWFNRQVYAYTGHAEGDLDGAAGWGAVVHPEDLPGAAETWSRALSTGASYKTEFRIRRADGAWRWFVVHAEPVRDDHGAITRWVGANIDIEDIRRQGEELERVNELLSGLLAGSRAERDQLWTLSQDMLARADYSGGLSAVNPAWTRILGWTERELLTNPYADIINPANLRETAAALEEMRKTGQPARFENRILAKTGEWTPIGWTVAPESDGINFIAVGRDLTEDKARELELTKAQEALRQSQKMEAVGQLTGGIAHDFNNLLAGISGSLELLEKRLAEGRLGGMERYISAAQGASRRAASLTQRLLAFSRRQTLAPQPTDVNRLVAGMEDLIRRSVGPDIIVQVVGADDLWTTRVDQPQLENALLNLCINSRDAMAPDGGDLTITTANMALDDLAARDRGLSPGQYVSLCVADTGSGMSPDVVAQAFDPFFTTKPLGQGTGLGLSMIHGFVRQSGGEVRIESQVGQGTNICLYLPRATGEVNDATPAEPMLATDPGQGETVLVIDDEPTVRMLVAEVLDEAGYIVIQADDGPSGLAILQSDTRIDLLISDVGLPGGMNGRQVADAARVTRPELKVLFITGYAENAAVGNGLLDAGMEVITKPFAMTTLAAKVREIISG